MKSFLLVRSQSQISTDNRLSLSASFSWLEKRREKGMVLFWKPSLHRRALHAPGMQNEGMVFNDRSALEHFITRPHLFQRENAEFLP